MKTVTFAEDFRFQRDALTAVKYRAGGTYSLSEEAAKAARKAGVLKKEPTRARSRNRIAKGGTPGAEGQPGADADPAGDVDPPADGTS